MKIGVIGSGEVAKVLAAGFLKHGHDVVIGSRDPAKLKDWAKQRIRALAWAVSATLRNSEKSSR